MAITQIAVNTMPGNLPSLNDDFFIMALSDISSAINFKYVVDIYDNDGNQIIRSRVYPDVNTNACYFDVSSILRNQLKFDWFFKMSETINEMHCWELDRNNGEAAVAFTVYVGEEYYSGVDLINDYQQLSEFARAWNFVPTVLGRMLNKSGIDKYIGKPATRRPFSMKYIKDSINPLFIGFRNISGAINASVEVFDASGAMIANDVVMLPFINATLEQCNLSPLAINTSYGSELINTNAADYYTVEFDCDGILSKLTIDLICQSEDIEPVYMHFMNSLGVFDTVIFNMVNKKFSSVSRKGFIRKSVIFGNEETPLSLNYYSGTVNKVQYENKINFDNAADYSMRLQTDFLTDAEFEWLGDLIMSPQVFISSNIGAPNGGCAFYPVTIKSDNYEYFRRRYAKLKNLEIEIELNQPRNFYRR